MKTTRMVAVEVDAPHPWAPAVERFRPCDLWVFYGTKLERAQRQRWRPRPAQVGGADTGVGVVQPSA